MQREEKMLEVALETLISRVGDMKNSVASFLMKIDHEHEVITWPTMLDNFALLSGQANTILKILKNDKTPPLRNQIVLPIRLNPDKDEELMKLTDKRVITFNHDVVPDYLRTKPDPDVELREQQLFQRSNQLIAEAGPVSKQINIINKAVNTTLELINGAKEKWESEATSRATAALTSSVPDTNMLISAVCFGKGLKPQLKMPGPVPNLPGVQTQPGQQQMSTNVGNVGGIGVGGGGPPGKAPSAIKTTIKSASAIHPYGR